MKLFSSKFLPVVALLTLGVSVCLTGCDLLSDIEDEEGQEVSSGSYEDEEDTNANYGELSEGDTAPDFTAELVDGSKFSLSENSGKVILINLWATWCGPCVEEMPAFEKLNKEYGDDVKIVCVNCMEAKSDVNSFVKQNGYTFPVAYDESGAINMKYPTQGIPYTLVVGKDGKVKNIYVGSAGMEQQYQTYKDAIDAAIAE
ncbi:MAG: TlpA family protein disulfide reductase [Lachnospiraceae bacterium]|jgi:thiol-disulfide isomerase/thioredoxin|nr:TlpA family protein disulfide reductase [Lachnospiraceae bacterium]